MPAKLRYSVLGGPLVDSNPADSGVFRLGRVSGKRNLGMTSMSFRSAGSPWPDQWPDYLHGTGRQWNMLRGYAFVGSLVDPPTPFPVPPGYPTTVFPFSGDPVTQSGFIDGLGQTYSPAPGDRRLQLNSGPSRLAPGDTSEMSLVFTVGLGADHLSSITVMKANVRKARKAYESLFDLPHGPERPDVKAVELDGSVVLEWGSNRQRILKTESAVVTNQYSFEGYNIYQLPAPFSPLSAGKKIATFDLVNGITIISGTEYDPKLGQFQPVFLQRGTDSGIRRFIRLNRDYLVDGAALYNGTDYFFAVTAYNYTSADPAYPSFESQACAVTVKPRIHFGVVLPASFGDTISVSHVSGAGGGTVLPIVIDPTAGTGDTYEVRFDATNPVQWSVANVTKGIAMLSDQTNQSGDDDYLIADGILVKVVNNPTQLHTSADVYRYTVPLVTQTPAAIKTSIQHIGVYPNPFVPGQSQRPANVVTFNNLPPHVTIRIFNFAGQLVRTLRKNGPSQFLEWNLTNEQNWQVASGIYVCHIEMPEIHESKVLKLAIVQSQLFGPN